MKEKESTWIYTHVWKVARYENNQVEVQAQGSRINYFDPSGWMLPKSKKTN